MLFIKIRTAISLGMINLARVLIYRIGLKFGFNPVKTISAKIEKDFFFDGSRLNSKVRLPFNTDWLQQQKYFGWKVISSKDIPIWYKNVLTQKNVRTPFLSWWSIPDFDPELGDIKGVWEASRFDWVLCFAQQAATGDKQAIDKLNKWLSNWIENNKPYQGVNWKCGQEASIRIMHLAMASLILKNYFNTQISLLSLVKAHLQRIEPTISYAMAQDNNHGTSEAAALYIGGSWLVSNDVAIGERWHKIGQKWLENRANKLIENDGSFSQYSTTYHRLLLDTFSMVEIWRKQFSLPPFSDSLYRKIKLATNWLYQFTQETGGDAPNLGANDGARLLPLTNTHYRDFRQSVQLASVLFYHKRAWSKDGMYNLPLMWMNISIPKAQLPKASNFHFQNGGYFGLRARKGASFLMMRYPNFRFRPSQCDALHVDFWLDGENLLRDGGTFSYNADAQHLNYYGGIQSHNSIQFDHGEQMPRLSRFLLGAWVKAKDIIYNEYSNECQASYMDVNKNQHTRKVRLNDKCLFVKDVISGFNKSAIIRWRLKPGNWEINGNLLSNGKNTISVSADTPIIRFELTKGKESRYYYQETDIPVLEVEVEQACSIITEYQY